MSLCLFDSIVSLIGRIKEKFFGGGGAAFDFDRARKDFPYFCEYIYGRKLSDIEMRAIWWSWKKPLDDLCENYKDIILGGYSSGCPDDSNSDLRRRGGLYPAAKDVKYVGDDPRPKKSAPSADVILDQIAKDTVELAKGMETTRRAGQDLKPGATIRAGKDDIVIESDFPHIDLAPHYIGTVKKPTVSVDPAIENKEEMVYVRADRPRCCFHQENVEFYPRVEIPIKTAIELKIIPQQREEPFCNHQSISVDFGKKGKPTIVCIGPDGKTLNQDHLKHLKLASKIFKEAKDRYINGSKSEFVKQYEAFEPVIPKCGPNDKYIHIGTPTIGYGDLPPGEHEIQHTDGSVDQVTVHSDKSITRERNVDCENFNKALDKISKWFLASAPNYRKYHIFGRILPRKRDMEILDPRCLDVFKPERHAGITEIKQ